MAQLRTYENATLTAHRLDPETGGVTGALYEQAGDLIVESQRSIGSGDRWRVADPLTVPPATSVGKYARDGADLYLEEAVFGGHIFRSWGHLVTESLSTAWAADQLPADVPLLMLPWAAFPPGVAARGTLLLRMAGWGARPILIASSDAYFGRVHVPDRLVDIDDVVHHDGHIDPLMNGVYDRMADNARQSPTGPSSAVFLARPATHRRSHPNEAAITGQLAAEGIEIVEAWQHPVAEQIRIADRASVLVGFSGSNMHNSVWARRGTPLVEIQDRRAQGRTRKGLLNFQDPLCALREQPMTYIRGIENGEPRPADAIVADTLAALHHAATTA